MAQEEPFETCIQFYQQGSTKQASFKYANLNATHFQQCIYDDNKCALGQLCKDIKLGCNALNVTGDVISANEAITGACGVVLSFSFSFFLSLSSRSVFVSRVANDGTNAF